MLVMDQSWQKVDWDDPADMHAKQQALADFRAYLRKAAIRRIAIISSSTVGVGGIFALISLVGARSAVSMLTMGASILAALISTNLTENDSTIVSAEAIRAMSVHGQRLLLEISKWRTDAVVRNADLAEAVRHFSYDLVRKQSADRQEVILAEARQLQREAADKVEVNTSTTNEPGEKHE